MTADGSEPGGGAAAIDSAEPAGRAPHETDPREPPRSTRGEAALIAGGVTAATALAVAFAFSPTRAGTPGLFVPLGVLYAGMAGVTALWLRRRGELRAALRPVSGDVARGAFVAALLYGVAMAVHLTISPHGSPREAWIMRLYLQLGDPTEDPRVLFGLAVFAVAALEEVVWRGFVMRALEGPFGALLGWLLSSALFAVAHLPTAFLLSDPVAGPNPLIVLAGLGCSLAWGRVVHRTGRLVPALFAHAFFSWAAVSFPLWRP